MPTPLSQFLRQQLVAQQLSEREFALRSGLGLSHVYQILRGDKKHTRGDTLDKIAEALGMAPSEMQVAMGKGSTDLAPDDVEVLAAYRRVPAEKKETAKDLLHALGVQPTQPRANDLSRRVDKRREAALRKIERAQAKGGKTGPNDTLTPDSHWIADRLHDARRAFPRRVAATTG